MKSKTILIVEDNECVREMFAEYLGHYFTVVTCCDGSEAVKLFAEKKFDLIMLDMIMPVMNGSECFEKLKEMKPDVKVIIMSGYCDSDELQKCLDNGVLKFFLKPLRIDELKDYITEVI